MIIDELGDFVFENYCRKTGFEREDSYYLMKHQKKKDLQLFAIKLTERKKPDQRNANENYQSYSKKKQTKKKHTHTHTKSVK